MKTLPGTVEKSVQTRFPHEGSTITICLSLSDLSQQNKPLRRAHSTHPFSSCQSVRLKKPPARSRGWRATD
ncbi:uncharacterized [Tachysurus ichikawai]